MSKKIPVFGKRRFLCGLAAVILLGLTGCDRTTPNVSAETPSPSEDTDLNVYGTLSGAARFFKDLEAGRFPFSFVCGSETAAEVLGRISPEKTENYDSIHDTKKTSYRYTDTSTNLLVTVEVTSFKDFDAVDWVLFFENAGDGNTPAIKDVRILDSVLDGIDTSQTILDYSKGSDYRVDDFLPQQQPLPPGESFTLKARGGKSSANHLPFFNLSDQNKGVIGSIGWTGQWMCKMTSSVNGVRVQVGMEETNFVLYPGESVRTPSMLLLYWDNGYQNSFNACRQLTLRHYSPPADDPLDLAPISNGTWGGSDTDTHLLWINALSKNELKYDYYWIDAGWSGPSDNAQLNNQGKYPGAWTEHVGDWRVNTTIHPNGLKAISDMAHENGYRFLLWIEPERAIAGTPITNEHPEWFLGNRTKGSQNLVDLGNPDALRWMTDTVIDILEEQNVDCYRQDFNIDPLNFWTTADAPDRVGITEMKYVEGLYTFLDTLLERFPGLLIDNCASGGQRIDIEMMKRSVVLWRSDYQNLETFDPTAPQIQNSGLSLWYPLTGSRAGVKPMDTYNFRSSLGSNMRFEAAMISTYPMGWHKEMMQDFFKLRPYFLGDYYALTPISDQKDVWYAYQLMLTDGSEGSILGFRRDNCASSTYNIRLCGLQPSALYTLTDSDTGYVSEHTGENLMNQGYTLTAESVRESKLIYIDKQ